MPAIQNDPRANQNFQATALDTDLVDLRIMATSDLHAHLLPWDHHADIPSETRGLARVASLIDQARAQAPQSLLFDNGDFLHGSALSDHWAEHWDKRTLHPMIDAMNRLSYDAVALGNHEFSRGKAFLRAALERADFPVLSANAYARDQTHLVRPWLLLPQRLRDGAGREQVLTVGVIGFLPPQTTRWERSVLGGHLAVEDILACAQRQVPSLRAAGADIVIALSHSGIEPEGAAAGGGENLSRALAALPGIDALIAGHTHQVFPLPGQAGCLSGKPVVMPGFYGSHLGVIDLTLQQDRGRWHVVAHRSEARPIASRDLACGRAVALVQSRGDLVELAAKDHAALAVAASRQIGETPRRLHSYFALIAPCEALELVATAQVRFVTEALAAGPLADTPVIAAVAPFKAGGRGGPENYTDIPAGPLTLRHASDLYVHPNNLVALRLTGAEVAVWLERVVSLFHRIAPGSQDASLINTDFPSFNFDLLYGLRYRIDLSQPARFDAMGREVNPKARRIHGLRLNGKPLRARQSLLVVTHNYRASGGAGFPGTDGNTPVLSDPVQIRGLVARQISDTAPAAPLVKADWGFLPMPGTAVVFDSSPRAESAVLDSGLPLEPVALQPSGFMRFRLQL